MTSGNIRVKYVFKTPLVIPLKVSLWLWPEFSKLDLFSLKGKSLAFQLVRIPVNTGCLQCFTFWLSFVLITTLQYSYSKSLPYTWTSSACNVKSLSIITWTAGHSAAIETYICLLQSDKPMLFLSKTVVFTPLQLSEASLATKSHCHWGQWDTSRKEAKIQPGLKVFAPQSLCLLVLRPLHLLDLNEQRVQ